MHLGILGLYRWIVRPRSNAFFGFAVVFKTCQVHAVDRRNLDTLENWIKNSVFLFQKRVWTCLEKSFWTWESSAEVPPCHINLETLQVPVGLLGEFASAMSWGQLHGEQFDPWRFHPKRLPVQRVELCHCFNWLPFGASCNFKPKWLGHILGHIRTIFEILATWF